MIGFIYPGQGSQYEGMGLDLYEQGGIAKDLFDQADDILNFPISKTMFEGTAEELRETKVTQPAIFIHSVILSKVLETKLEPNMVAGHSLGEFSALTANGVLPFENGLLLVSERAKAMQKACEQNKGIMAAILGLDDAVSEKICNSIQGIVVPANYNCPGQLVISGEEQAVNTACEELTKAGASRCVILPVSGAFHSPLMEPAKIHLANAIENTLFNKPSCEIYQNVTAKGTKNTDEIKKNLIAQLTAPVRWTQSVLEMKSKGGTRFYEMGPGNVLKGLVRKIDRSIEVNHGTKIL